MTDSYKNMNPEDEKIKKMLSDLPKHNAPDGFEDKLLSNIRKINNGEDVSLIPTQSRNWLIPTLSSAAGLACAFVLFNLFDASSATPVEQKQQLATTPIEVKVDSTKEVQSTSSQQLNLVKDKK